MKRLLTLGLGIALGALALGCAVEAEEPTDEQAGEQSEGLLEDEDGTTTPGRSPTGQSGVTSTADPNGPSPYPWRPKTYSADPNGPSPYPWGGTGTGSGSGSTGAGTGDDTGDDDGTSSGQQKTGPTGP